MGNGPDKHRLWQPPPSLRPEHCTLWGEVCWLVAKADPIHLLCMGAPQDEYDSECAELFPRLVGDEGPAPQSAAEVTVVVHEVFKHWFGTAHRQTATGWVETDLGEAVCGPVAEYAGLGEQIWQALCKWKRENPA